MFVFYLGFFFYHVFLPCIFLRFRQLAFRPCFLIKRVLLRGRWSNSSYDASASENSSSTTFTINSTEGEQQGK